MSSVSKHLHHITSWRHKCVTAVLSKFMIKIRSIGCGGFLSDILEANDLKNELTFISYSPQSLKSFKSYLKDLTCV